MSSDVQVFVRFKDKYVFAGEEVSCVINFRNTASSAEPLASAPTNGRGNLPSNRVGSHGHGPKRSISQGLAHKARHRPSYSVSIPPPPLDTDLPPSSYRPDQKHQRSVSIVSMNSPPISAPIDSRQGEGRQSPHMGHRRSSTVHLTSDTAKRTGMGARQVSGDFRLPGRRSPLSASHTPIEMKAPIPDFKFPPTNSYDNADSNADTSRQAVNKRPLHRTASSTGQVGHLRENVGIGIYNHSNHSGETLGSEQTSMVSERPGLTNAPRLPQRASSVTMRKPKAATLLMGYAQVGATFVLDSSLVDQTQFEEVKKKGFLGGQAGGGVVGVKKKARPSSGFFGGFNFGSIGESLENIMGGDNLSSVKEMKAVTSSRAIPLLSTPQSLLFVDLHLEPGEEKSYSFAYRLPTGLPSSYKGKAIRINYNLTIGVQGAPGAREMQAVRQINVPIRVFSGVDTDGEIFGHDLMQPYVILRDLARTKLILPSDEDAESSTWSDQSPDMTSQDFLKYVSTLLDQKRRRQSSVGTLDFNLLGGKGGSGDVPGNPTTRAINRAIFHSNQITGSNESSPNRFEIARSGSRIATVVLDRPLHRLGETITTVIDFSKSQMTCTSLRATLESGERVSDTLAVRSASAISRITKRVYASQSDNILFSKRAVFCATIPVSAAPTFVTSGVNLDWYIKLEFGTLRGSAEDEKPQFLEVEQPTQSTRSARPSRTQSSQHGLHLLEEIMKDERGVVQVAVESLDCDTFEVAIPITVYGNMVTDGKDGDGEQVGIPI